MAKSANGSIFSFAGTACGDLLSIRFGESGTAIDASNLASSVHIVEAGIKEQECSIEINGRITNYTYGLTGALTITLADNTSVTVGIGTGVCMGIDVNAPLDGKVTSTITFKPHA